MIGRGRNLPQNAALGKTAGKLHEIAFAESRFPNRRLRRGGFVPFSAATIGAMPRSGAPDNPPSADAQGRLPGAAIPGRQSLSRGQGHAGAVDFRKKFSGMAG
ncbi:hypothetical protein [Rhodobacter capsulatus]|uniref:hypothetical protein n=1 Tax=Rhodobacter capsulatus TaxID=1061 RepID=UPI00146EABEB|nr:hypothetical protein [Rhodobacter capsulatus]